MRCNTRTALARGSAPYWTAIWVCVAVHVPFPAWGQQASDAASLQFTVPAPDPVQASETLAIQALAVNTGAAAWPAGSYYWVAEVYGLDYKLIARTKEVTPNETVQPGGIAAISLPFPVPATMVGRKLYRIFLIKDAKTLIESDYKPFQIVEKELPPPPPPAEVVDYRVEGNLTLSYKNSSSNQWAQHRGATTINIVGKLKESSYLFNGHLIHEPGKVVDPFILLLTYYAPWGRVYAGDVSPSLSVLSVYGQGLRGLMLEQQKGKLDWTLLGGQTITSQPGTQSVNGRYARSLYAAKGGYQLIETLKGSVNAFLSADETGSLSTDPKSPDFRGPTLRPQKNAGFGAGLSWQPTPRVTVLADYQKNSYYADAGGPGVSDQAWRGELRWDRKLFKWKSFLQRAGPRFVAFSAPAVVGDRLTLDTSLSVFPISWYTLSLGGNQYRDNLDSDPLRVTTTQRTATVGNSFQFASGTGFNVSGILTTAQGDPRAALDNQTTTLGARLTQVLMRHSFAVNAQSVQFRDKNHLAHDLDTTTLGFNTNLSLPRDWRSSLGITNSDTKDKFDGSKRTAQAASASVTVPISKRWTAQVFGSMTASKSNSPLFPTDSRTMSANSEFTWIRTPKSTLTFGPGFNQAKDVYFPSRNISELTASIRYSQSF